jgi:RasGEF domain/FYVE zinc finger/RasGEF N-terminal motif
MSNNDGRERVDSCPPPPAFHRILSKQVSPAAAAAIAEAVPPHQQHTHTHPGSITPQVPPPLPPRQQHHDEKHTTLQSPSPHSNSTSLSGVDEVKARLIVAALSGKSDTLADVSKISENASDTVKWLYARLQKQTAVYDEDKTERALLQSLRLMPNKQSRRSIVTSSFLSPVDQMRLRLRQARVRAASHTGDSAMPVPKPTRPTPAPPLSALESKRLQAQSGLAVHRDSDNEPPPPTAHHVHVNYATQSMPQPPSHLTVDAIMDRSPTESTSGGVSDPSPTMAHSADSQSNSALAGQQPSTPSSTSSSNADEELPTVRSWPTLSALVLDMCSILPGNVETRNAVLLTMHYFTSPPVILKELLRILTRPPPSRPPLPPGPKPSSIQASTPPALGQIAATEMSVRINEWKATKMRLFSVLKHWITMYTSDFMHASMILHLRESLMAFPPLEWSHRVAAATSGHASAGQIDDLRMIATSILETFEHAISRHDDPGHSQANAQIEQKLPPANPHSRDHWVPDHVASSCLKCWKLFTLTNRRHHCRNCGILVCGECSSKKLALDSIHDKADTQDADTSSNLSSTPATQPLSEDQVTDVPVFPPKKKKTPHSRAKSLFGFALQKRPKQVRVCDDCYSMLIAPDAHHQDSVSAGDAHISSPISSPRHGPPPPPPPLRMASSPPVQTSGSVSTGGGSAAYPGGAPQPSPPPSSSALVGAELDPLALQAAHVPKSASDATAKLMSSKFNRAVSLVNLQKQSSLHNVLSKSLNENRAQDLIKVPAQDIANQLTLIAKRRMQDIGGPRDFMKNPHKWLKNLIADEAKKVEEQEAVAEAAAEASVDERPGLPRITTVQNSMANALSKTIETIQPINKARGVAPSHEFRDGRLTEREHNALRAHMFDNASSTSNQRQWQMRMSNQMSVWISSEVLGGASESHRAKTLQKWIKVASHCYELRNYNTVFEILTGLSHSSVYRLHDLWDSLPSSVSSTYKRLSEVVHYSRNYRAYRAELRDVLAEGRPFLPYLGVMLRDIVALEEGGMWVYEDNDVCGDESLSGPAYRHVNFTKCVQIARLVTETLTCRHSKYDQIPIDATLQMRLLAGMIQALDEKELMNRSYDIRPRPKRRNRSNITTSTETTVTTETTETTESTETTDTTGTAPTVS